MARSVSADNDYRHLDITRDELEKIGEALKKEEFRKLLIEYCEEVNDPVNKKQFQEDIKQLERERGNEVTFINPVPGYVIKTSEGGTRKAFVNVCANEHVDKPQSNPEIQNGNRGLRWSLPYSLAQPRDDYDRKNKRCIVYDVVFHPDTLHLALKNKAFYDMVNATACDAVESNFDVKLDRKNLKFPKMQYKGNAVPSVVRKKIAEPKDMSPEEVEFFNKIYPPQQHNNNKKVDRKRKSNGAKKSSNSNNKENDNGQGEDDGQGRSPYTRPVFVIKHRSGIELEEFAYDRNAKMNAAIPKELAVEIQLPLLRSAADMVLDVSEKHVNLISEKPAKYKLDLTLPYMVFQDSGNAKFDKDTKTLTITLPVRRNSNISIVSDVSQDSGVESDHGTSPPSSCDDSDCGGGAPMVQELSDIVVSGEVMVSEKTRGLKSAEDTALRTEKCNNSSSSGNESIEKFLDPDYQYLLPEHTCHVFENTVAFTLNVKNVDAGSVKTKLSDAAVHVKFSSISSGFFPIYYAFYLEFHSVSVDPGHVNVETWDNNVVVQITLDSSDGDITSYLYGLSADLVNERQIEEPSAISDKFEDDLLLNSDDDDDDVLAKNDQEDDRKPYVEVDVQEQEVSITIQARESSEPDSEGDRRRKGGLKIRRQESAYSESSGDELSLSCSHSPGKGRGILKRWSGCRSVSESSVDDFMWTSSFENCAASVDSVIPEENGVGSETSASLKKTVRFNDVVSRQLFRSNSSILGQKKKNQRKNRNKKRAQERRYSESEVSESEEKKDGSNVDIDDDKSIDLCTSTANGIVNGGKHNDLIFHIDM